MSYLNIAWPVKSIYRSLIICAILAVTCSALAQAQASFNVVDVKVEGNRTSKETLIKSVAGIKPGDQLTATTTQEAVSRLYGLGFFDDVEILAEEAVGGLILTIKVKELPKLGVMKIEGNSQIKEKDLREEINLAANSYLSKNLIYEKRNKIIDYYGKKGYFYVKVDYELKYHADSLFADLTYKIKEGQKLKVETVVLTGIERADSAKVVSKMRNRKRGFLRTSDFDKEKYDEDKDKVIEYLHKEGYIDAYLKSDSIAIDTVRSRMTIYFDIYEGPRYYFGETKFTGNDILPSELLQKVLKYEKGKVFNFEKFDESIYEIYFAYQEKGYLHVRVIDDRNTRDSLIDVTFDIVEGLPSEVNFVKIIGNTRTKEKVIRREMKIRPGQVFHRSLLMRSIRDVMALNYFGNVVPDIKDLPSGDVDVVVEVEEKPTAQVSAGAGYSEQDKFVGTFGLGIPNFRGMGQTLSMNMELGSRRDSYSFSFTEPWLFGNPTSVGIDLYYTNREWEDEYTEGRRGISLRIGRRLRWPDNYFKIFAKYRLEDDRYYDYSDSYIQYLSQTEINREINTYNDPIEGLTSDTTDAVVYGDVLPGTLIDNFGEDWFRSSTIQFTLIRDSRDLPEFSTRGSLFSYSFSNTGGLMGGYFKYQKHELSFAKFFPLFWKVALASKVTFGAIRAPDGDNRILEFDRYTPGGTGYSGVVRGYDDGSLRPDSIRTYSVPINIHEVVDTGGVSLDTNYVEYESSTQYTTTVRGKYMLVGNLELQMPIIENQLYFLTFFDVGNSWLHHTDIKLNDMYKGVGLGFRLVVPGIGTIGFDFGYALDDVYGPDGTLRQDKGWKPHFQIGTVFR